jgi:hypothetical protein
VTTQLAVLPSRPQYGHCTPGEETQTPPGALNPPPCGSAVDSEFNLFEVVADVQEYQNALQLRSAGHGG